MKCERCKIEMTWQPSIFSWHCHCCKRTVAEEPLIRVPELCRASEVQHIRGGEREQA